MAVPGLGTELQRPWEFPERKEHLCYASEVMVWPSLRSFGVGAGHQEDHRRAQTCGSFNH